MSTQRQRRAEAPELKPGQLSKPELLQMYRTMLLARRLDERMWLLNRQGKIAFVISCQGHEGAQVGIAKALRPGVDWVLPYYRDLALVLALGMTAREAMLGAFARAEDPSSGGRQMPSHYGSPRLRIVSGSSPVATQIPHAVGVALASKLRREDAVAVTCLGEGSTSQGDFHEGLNFAAVHSLPVVFVCENNGWAISTPLREEMAVKRVSKRARAYGMPGETVDGSDLLGVYEAMQRAVARARQGEGPTLLEVLTVRLTSHSSDDNQFTYRPKKELATETRHHEPLAACGRYLRQAGILDDAKAQELEAAVAAEVDDATDYAERAAPPAPETLLERVYAEG
ncbi:MAG: thiamine pyrophosphate-dependent dehydrogenase E1 component subunit alpha [Chloroflexi bacterium]|nr:thiamine pyrophosphate-dependent dehydrogenase E1 component subunit alpha [Chloroflexota bacterium]